MKELNIFRKAPFGKAYRTRDGRKAIYVGRKSKYLHFVVVEGSPKYLTYFEYGRRFEDNASKELSDYDIVGIWDFSISFERFHAPKDMDKECIQLCKKLNSLSNIKTTESCCGHCREPYRIWFNSVNAYSLAIIAGVFDRRYSETNVGYRVCMLTKDIERFPQYIYMIESIEPYLSQEDMEEDIKTIVDNFTYWQQPEFNSYFRKGGKDD